MRKLLSIFTGVFLLLAFSILPAVAGEGDDEQEPNDSRSLADSIDGFVIHGDVDEDDTDDWFMLQGQEGVEATFEIILDADEVEVDFEVFSGEDQVGLAQDWGSGERITCEIPSTCYVHAYRWSGEGEYMIKIYPESCAGLSEVESNDTMGLADLVEDLEINGFMCEEDEDWFVLNGQEGFNPTFTIYFDDSEGFEIDFEIYSGDELVEGAYDWGSGESITCEVPSTCYVRVYYWEGEGEYRIAIEPEGH